MANRDDEREPDDVDIDWEREADLAEHAYERNLFDPHRHTRRDADQQRYVRENTRQKPGVPKDSSEDE